MALASQGSCRIKNVKANVYVGRSPIEDSSTLPKNFVPLKSEKVGKNAIFQYGRGFNPKLWELHSLKSGVAKAGEISLDAPHPRPAAFIEAYVGDFFWEFDDEKDRDVIRDSQSKKVWTLSAATGTHVTLEDEVEGDERQLWKLEQIEYTE